MSRLTLSPNGVGYPGPDVLPPQIGDVNGDGIPDLLLAADGTVGVAIGKGDGTFFPTQGFGVGPGAGQILLENLHGQSATSGLLDIVAPDGSGGGGVTVLINRTK